MIQTLKAESLYTSPMYLQTTLVSADCPRH